VMMFSRQFTYRGTIPKEAGEVQTAVVNTPQGKIIVTVSPQMEPICVKVEERSDQT